MNVKNFLELLVTSATYRQSSKSRPNSSSAIRIIACSRAAAFSDSAEMVRDRRLR